MSVQQRYDAVLKDIMTLFQEALYRFFTLQQVDVHKFKHYFCNFNRNMAKLQQQFHASQPKHSKNLKKLQEFFCKQPNPKISLQPTPMKAVKPSPNISQPKFQSLNVIGQEQQQFPQQQSKRRSGTAEGRRTKNSFTIDFEHGRPKTGVHRSNDRYSKTIQSNHKSLQLKQTRKERKDRKDFYDDLERSSQAEVIYENKVKIPKKKTLGSHRWSFKINKLF